MSWKFRGMCVLTLLFALDAQAHIQTVSVDDLSVPANARKYYDAGVAATQSRKWQKAHDLFQHALRIDPQFARAHNALGVVLALMGRRMGETAFRTAILFDPKLPDAHFNLGKLLLESSRPAEAKQELQRALHIESRHPAASELLVESMLMTNDERSAALLMRSLHERPVEHRA